MKEMPGYSEMGPVRVSRGEASGTIAFGVKKMRTQQEMAEIRALDPKNAKVRMDYWMVAVNGEELYGPYDDLQAFAVTLSPNGQKVAYPAERKGRWALYIDGARRTDDLPLWIVFNNNNMMEMVALDEKDGFVFLQESME
jgi:hypothetical protein